MPSKLFEAYLELALWLMFLPLYVFMSYSSITNLNNYYLTKEVEMIKSILEDATHLSFHTNSTLSIDLSQEYIIQTNNETLKIEKGGISTKSIFTNIKFCRNERLIADRIIITKNGDCIDIKKE